MTIPKIGAQALNTLSNMPKPTSVQQTLVVASIALPVVSGIDYCMSKGEDKTYAASKTALRIGICSAGGIITRAVGKLLGKMAAIRADLPVPQDIQNIFSSIVEKRSSLGGAISDAGKLLENANGKEYVKAADKSKNILQQSLDTIFANAGKLKDGAINIISGNKELPHKASQLIETLKGADLANISDDVAKKVAQTLDLNTGFLNTLGICKGKTDIQGAKMLVQNAAKGLTQTNADDKALETVASKVLAKNAYAGSLGEVLGISFAMCSIFVEAALVNKTLKYAEKYLQKFMNKGEQHFDNSDKYPATLGAVENAK